MMLGRRRKELEDQAVHLEQQQRRADREHREVQAKQPFIERLAHKVSEYHAENHVTESMVFIFSGGRKSP